ncbi:MAG: AAA family ATPase [Chloroflexi bacterium]|nr:AAA family ATPase [Chloroflexota bacterium]
MKEMFDWVPWFNELASKIAGGGRKYLDDRAKEVNWQGGSPLTNVDVLNPLLFITVVANESQKAESRERVFASLAEVFEIRPLQTAVSRDVWHFPHSLRLFQYDNPADPANQDAAWQLLRGAVSGSLDAETFESAIDCLRNIGWAKLTTMLFLIDATSYLRLSKGYPDAYGVGGVDGEPNWTEYQSRIAEARANFPGCELYEIEMFARLQGSRNEGGQNLVVEPGHCWISTSNASWETSKGDHWTEFRDNYYVRTDNSEEYPVDRSEPGHLMLVRYGPKRGRGIGVVYRNDYGQKRRQEGRIHVLWLSKDSAELKTSVQTRAFDEASEHVVGAFRQPAEYVPTWELLDSITYRREVGVALDRDGTDLGKVWKLRQGRKTKTEIRRKVLNEPQVSQTLELILEGVLPPTMRKAAARRVRGFRDRHARTFCSATSAKLARLAEECSGGPSPDSREPETLQPPTAPQEAVQEVLHDLNQILYGPPGTGKTYGTVGHALAIVDGADVKTDISDEDKQRFRDLGFETGDDSKDRPENRIAMVTFHQNYAYEDFVEGIRPRLHSSSGAGEEHASSTSDDIGYELRHGIFRRMCAAAGKVRETARNEENPAPRFVLIIDEINRGNIAKIFGELITLIEPSRRLGSDDATTVTLPYSGEDFGVPDNLYLIGTMNTADRSIQQLDTALRRRFTFVEMMPDSNHTLIPEELVSNDGSVVNCREMLRAMNERIALLMDREHQIGHTYLLEVKSIEDLADRFRNRIFPLLQEYFYDDWRRIGAVLGGNAFVRKANASNGYSEQLIEKLDFVDEDRMIHERLPDDDPAWNTAEEYQRIYEPKSG